MHDGNRAHWQIFIVSLAIVGALIGDAVAVAQEIRSSSELALKADDARATLEATINTPAVRSSLVGSESGLKRQRLYEQAVDLLDEVSRKSAARADHLQTRRDFVQAVRLLDHARYAAIRARSYDELKELESLEPAMRELDEYFNPKGAVNGASRD